MNIAFVTIHVQNLEESARFYQEVLGLQVASRLKGGPGVEIVFLKDEAGHQLELITGQGAPGGAKPGVTIGFAVSDLNQALAHLGRQGVPVVRGPITVPSGARLAFFHDPDGVELEFIEQGRA